MQDLTVHNCCGENTTTGGTRVLGIQEFLQGRMHFT